MESQIVEKRWKGSFWSLIVTQFQGAFSDNAFKNLVLFGVLAMNLPEARRQNMAFWVGSVFSLPFVFFSMAGGYLADKYSKRSVTIGTKVLEILVMVVALAGLASGSLPLQITAVFLLSSQAALFGPSKYGLLPEVLPVERLSWANGILELGTFVAIIMGTMAAGFLAETFAGRQHWSGLIFIGLAVAGVCTSLGIGRVPAADPNKTFRRNPLGDLAEQWRYIRQDRVLFLAVLANTYFWLLAALLQTNILFYGEDFLHVGAMQKGYLQAAVAIGIGAGSLAAGYLSGRKIEYGLIPLGMIGLTAFAALLFTNGLGFVSVAALLAILGVFAGFFAVPVNALIQHRPHPSRKGGVIAAANLISFVGIFMASALYYLFVSIGLDARQIFLASAFITLAGTIYTVVLLPESLLRFVVRFIIRLVYRIRIVGTDHVPATGGALLVSNHLSFVDALLLSAATDRPIRFVMFKDYYDNPFLHPFARLLGVIPISSTQQPRDMIRSLRMASDAIASGEVVCIFAEGQISRIGHMLPFRRGMERIIKGLDAPIVPVHLDGLWGSIFSYENRRFLWKMPKKIPYPVTVSYGAPMSSTATVSAVREAVQELHSEAYDLRKPHMQTLSSAFIASARRNPFRFAMADARGRLTFASALTRTVFLARRLKSTWKDQEMVGILLPPSVAGALVNFAAMMLGKTPVNLNYTLTSEGIASCARQCRIETVVTSKAFLEKVRVEAPGKVVLVEELVAGSHVYEKCLAALMAWILPAALLERALGGRQRKHVDDLATVIFSSGSTGDPKGVMLTHYNIGSNIQQLAQCFAFRRDDRMLGVLPFFHSFGFTGTLALPLIAGVGVVFHPSPLDARPIGDLVQKHKVTFLLATPTFLQAYMRRCEPEQFGSVRVVLVGAEKLQERVAQAFEDKFGIRPLEAYGCTECAPAVTINTRDFRAPGFRQVGAKRGKIGHPLPAVSVRIVDVESMQPLPAGQAGLLLVRGPNVMAGYLGRPEKTAEVIRDGWYVTGDIATCDPDGFLEITDRLSRFSKIGGEMVPHIKVEEKLHELAETHEQVFAVAGVPDEKKGERIVVLHTLPEERLKSCLERLNQVDLPNLWIPRANAFFRVEELPYLGSGKLDLRRIREMALQCAETGRNNVREEARQSVSDIPEEAAALSHHRGVIGE